MMNHLLMRNVQRNLPKILHPLRMNQKKNNYEDEKADPYTSKAANNSDSDTRQSGVQTIFVKGFDTSLGEDDIKSSLSKHFGSCGVISRVHVPTNRETNTVIGFAYI